MLKRIKHKLADQRGASLSMALLLMLVCVAISSIVLAAATTSAGRIAESGKADQRYYAVTSAVRLFETSLDENNVFTCTQTYKQTYDSDDEASATLGPERGESTSRYDFLEPLVWFALSGETDKDKAEKILAPKLGEWVEPFSNNWDDARLDKEYVVAEYKIARPEDVSSDDDNANRNVVVTAHLRDDWSLELVFSNEGHTDNDRFQVYMLLQADVGTEEHESEYSNPKVWEREMSIRWECVSIQQGRGFPSD